MTSDVDDAASVDDLRDVRLLLAGTDPAPAGPPTRPERRRARRILRGLTAPPKRPRVRATTRVAVAASAAAAAVAAPVMAVVLGGATASAAPFLPTPLITATSGDHAAAADLLHQAATRQRTATIPGAGPVRYTFSRTYSLDVAVAAPKSTTTAATYLVRTWRRPDGSGRVDQALQRVDRAGRDVGGPTPPPSPRRPSLSFGASPPETNVATLPTDPDRVQAWLAATGDAPDRHLTDTDTAAAILSVLKGGGTTPHQNAALYDLLARLPGVFDAGTTADHAGRAARAVGVQTSGQGSLVLATGYLLLSDDGTPLTIETVDTPNAPPGLHLPPGPTIEEYAELLDERQTLAVGATS